MATARLTTAIVEGVEVGPRDTYVWDSRLPRFGVRVTPAGARLYLVQYRAKGPPGRASTIRRMTIGQHGDLWPLDKARAVAKGKLALVDLGRDPFAEREAERVARAAADETVARRAIEAELRRRDCFEGVAERFITLGLAGNKSAGETARLLRHGPVPAWRDRHVAEVRRSDVADLLDAIKGRSASVARSTYDALQGLFSWAVERDLIAASPLAGLTAPPRPKARERVLADDELAVVWEAAKRLGGTFGPVVQLLMLTGQRRGEVGGMTWAELDLDGAIWRIPGDRTKNGKAHEIDLPAEAVKILKDLPRLGDHVFPARGEGAVRGFSATKRKLDQLVEAVRRERGLSPGEEGPADALPDWVLHDLRRTAATGMAALGFSPSVVERVLNHVSGTQSGLVGVYQRHEYRADRLAALTAWGAHVGAVVASRPPASNVVAIRA